MEKHIHHSGNWTASGTFDFKASVLLDNARVYFWHLGSFCPVFPCPNTKLDTSSILIFRENIYYCENRTASGTFDVKASVLLVRARVYFWHLGSLCHVLPCPKIHPKLCGHQLDLDILVELKLVNIRRGLLCYTKTWLAIVLGPSCVYPKVTLMYFRALEHRNTTASTHLFMPKFSFVETPDQP